jgi:hypothetical protein
MGSSSGDFKILKPIVRDETEIRILRTILRMFIRSYDRSLTHNKDFKRLMQKYPDVVKEFVN